MRSMAFKEAMACCKLYISESRNEKALSAIAAAAERHRQRAPVVNVFPDREYNRVGYTIVGSLNNQQQQQEGEGGGGGEEEAVSKEGVSLLRSALPLHRAVVGMVGAALSEIDMEQHVGSHPRLGVVDHMCFHPIGSATVASVASLALASAQEIGIRFQGFYSPRSCPLLRGVC
jgi:glutamate formiminotransferase